HATRADGGAGCRRRRSKARVRCDDGYEEDRRRRDRGGAARLTVQTFLQNRRASFDKLRMRGNLDGRKKDPHPELVEGRKAPIPIFRKRLIHALLRGWQARIPGNAATLPLDWPAEAVACDQGDITSR